MHINESVIEAFLTGRTIQYKEPKTNVWVCMDKEFKRDPIKDACMPWRVKPSIIESNYGRVINKLEMIPNETAFEFFALAFKAGAVASKNGDYPEDTTTGDTQ